MIPVNAMIVDSDSAVFQFAINGGKVIFITEDDERIAKFGNMPNKLMASVLLPPYEATVRELDGDIYGAQAIYNAWLSNRECFDFTALIVMAIMENIPVALYFGDQLREMQYPRMFMEFIAANYGIQFGFGVQSGVMNENFIPNNLGLFLINNLIDVPTFFNRMPVDTDLAVSAITVLIAVLKPLILNNNPTVEELNEYFKNIIREIHSTGRYLHNPIIAG